MIQNPKTKETKRSAFNSDKELLTFNLWNNTTQPVHQLVIWNKPVPFFGEDFLYVSAIFSSLSADECGYGVTSDDRLPRNSNISEANKQRYRFLFVFL